MAPHPFGINIDEVFGKDATRRTGAIIKNVCEMFNDLKAPGHACSGALLSDVYETNLNSFVVVSDVPGCEKSDVSVELIDDKTLRISARPKPLPYNIKREISRNRPEGEVSCEVSLPEEVDKESIVARCENGVLTVSFSKMFRPRTSRSVPVL